jgi:hypothetical protein
MQTSVWAVAVDVDVCSVTWGQGFESAMQSHIPASVRHMHNPSRVC